MRNQRNIDIVYLWVDGSDALWRNKKEEALKTHYSTNLPTTDGRYVDNNELKYSIRSVEKHLPWIRNIYIVTDNQTPSWIDTTHERIHIVDHREILPKEALPCFNSRVIERYIYRIPGLSERFLYANDDTFVNADLEPDFFFHENGFPYIRMQRQPFLRSEYRLKKLFNMKINSYRQSIENAVQLIKERYNLNAKGVLHHNIDGFLKEDMRLIVEDIFKDELEQNMTQFRRESDIQRILFSLYYIAENRGHLRFVSRSESARIRVQHPDFMHFIEKYNPKLFCLNDTEHATNNDRKRILPFLEALYPEKSIFEIN